MDWTQTDTDQLQALASRAAKQQNRVDLAVLFFRTMLIHIGVSSKFKHARWTFITQFRERMARVEPEYRQGDFLKELEPEPEPDPQLAPSPAPWLLDLQEIQTELFEIGPALGSIGLALASMNILERNQVMDYINLMAGKEESETTQSF